MATQQESTSSPDDRASASLPFSLQEAAEWANLSASSHHPEGTDKSYSEENLHITPTAPQPESSNTLPSLDQSSNEITPASPDDRGFASHPSSLQEEAKWENLSASSPPEETGEIISESGGSIPLAQNIGSIGALATQRSQSDIESQSRFTTVVASGLLAIFGGLTIGCALMVTGGLIGIEGFLLKFSKELYKRQAKATTDSVCVFVNFILLLFSSLVPLSGLLSIWVSYRLVHSWGRRPILICGSVLAILGSLLMAWFPNITFELVGLAIAGCGMGLLYQVIPLICHEANTGHNQSLLSFLFYYMLICGSTVARAITLAASQNFLNGWRWVLAACGIFASPIFLLSLSLNETPQFLTKQGRIEEAKLVLGRTRKFGAEGELQRLAHVLENEDKEPWKKLLHSPVLVVNVSAQFFQRLLGLDSIIFFGPLFLKSIGVEYHASFKASLYAGVVRTIVAGLACLGYKFFGRRRTLLCGCGGIIFAEISLLFIFHGANPLFKLNPQVNNFAIVCSILLIGCYSLLSNPQDWTEAPYPADVRTLGTCCEATVFFFMTLVMNLVTLRLICAFKAWIFALLGIVALCVGVLIYKLLPKITKKEDELSSEEAKMWKLHWFWKKLLPKEDNVV